MEKTQTYQIGWQPETKAGSMQEHKGGCEPCKGNGSRNCYSSSGEVLLANFDM